MAASIWSPGAVAQILPDFVSVKEFGAVCDGLTDDYDALQEGVDTLAARGGGSLWIPNHLRYRKAFSLLSGVSIIIPNADTKMICTGAGQQWPMYSSVIIGGYAYPNDTRAVRYALNNVAIGVKTVTVTTLADAAKFVAGDVVRLESSTSYDVGLSILVPTWLQMNVIESVNTSTGVLTLRHPMDAALVGGYIKQLCTNTTMLDASGNDTGVTLRAIRDAGIYGGTWITEQTDAPFCGTGAAIDCIFAPHKVISAAGVAYGNLYAYTTFRTDVQLTRRFGVELGFGSHNNTVEVETINSQNAGISAERLVGLTEGARGNTLRIGSINFGSNTVAVGFQILNSYDNNIYVSNVLGAAITDGTIEISHFLYPGTPNAPTGNTIEVSNCRVTSQGRYATLAQQAARNKIYGNYYGTITLTGGTSVDGSTENLFDARFENGHPRLANNAANNTFRGYYGLDRPATMDYLLFQDNIREYETPSNRIFRKLSWMQFTATYDQGNPFSKITTFPANSAIGGDRVKIKLDGLTTGGAGTKSITLTIAGTPILTMAIPTGNQTFSLEAELLFAFGTSITGTVRSMVGTTPTHTDVGLTGLDYAANAYSIALAATVASGGDTLTLRNAALKTIRLWAATEDWF